MPDNNFNLSELQIAAALADEIYRRDVPDMRIVVGRDLDMKVVAFNDPNGDPDNPLPLATISTRRGDTITFADNYYYGMDTGFVGRVVEKGDTIYVVYRGTDMAGGFGDLAKNWLGWKILNPDPTQIDLLDYSMANVRGGGDDGEPPSWGPGLDPLWQLSEVLQSTI